MKLELNSHKLLVSYKTNISLDKKLLRQQRNTTKEFYNKV